MSDKKCKCNNGRIDTCTHTDGNGKSYPCPVCNPQPAHIPDSGEKVDEKKFIKIIDGKECPDWIALAEAVCNENYSDKYKLRVFWAAFQESQLELSKQQAEIEKLKKHIKSVEFDLKCIRAIRKLRDNEITQLEIKCNAYSAENKRLKKAYEITKDTIVAAVQAVLNSGRSIPSHYVEKHGVRALQEAEQALKGEK